MTGDRPGTCTDLVCSTEEVGLECALMTDVLSTTPLELDRYLVPFDPRQVPLYRFDVVILGCGAAGSVAALTAAGAGATVAVVAKANLRESNTNYAQGGLAAVLSNDDSFDSHVVDTLDVGCGLSERAAVDAVVRGGPAAVERLLELGAEFDREAGGKLALSREGGHSHHRVIHAQGDATGIEIQRTVTLAIERHPRITTFAETFAIDLLSDPDGRVVGVLCRTERGDLVAFCGRSRAVSGAPSRDVGPRPAFRS